MRILGLVLTVVVIVMGIYNGGDLGSFIDTGSVIIVLGITIGSLLLAGSHIGTMFGAVFSANATTEELQAAARGWSQARRYVTTAGWVGFLVGLIIMLGNLDDPKALGPGIALALITIFYATVLANVVFLPLQSRLEDRVQEQTG